MRSPVPQPTVVFTVSRVRYKVLAFGVCLAAITYLDRVCISITAPEIMRELSLSRLQMSFVFSAFTMAYGVFEIPTGWWGDRVGTRRVLTRIVSWWSFFTMATAAAFNYASLLRGAISVRCGRGWGMAERGQDLFPLVSLKRARHCPGNLLHGCSPGRWPDSAAGDSSARAFPLADGVPHFWGGRIRLGRRLVSLVSRRPGTAPCREPL